MAAVLKTSEDYLLVQSRSFSDQEFAQHVRQTVSCVAAGQRGTECGNLLRDLYRYLTCRTKRRSFSDELLKQLKNMIVEPGKSPKALRLLAMLILRDLSPTIGYSVKISNLSADLNWLSLVFPLIFAQGEELGHIAAHVPIFIRWLKNSPGSISSIQRNSLLCLYSIQNNYGIHLLNEDQITTVNQRILDWMTDTSVYSAPNPYQRKIFNKSKQIKLQTVTEIDGSTCHSFFTVLNIAHYCSSDQWLNIYSFSILRQWLLNTWCEDLGETSVDIPQDQDTISTDSSFVTARSSFNEPTILDDRMLRTPGADEIYEEISDKHSTPTLPGGSPSFSDITQAFSDHSSSTPVKEHDDTVSVGSYSNLSSMRQAFGSESSFFTESHQGDSLARKAMAYCRRLLRQSECKPTTPQDALLKKACIIEAVSLMDFFCLQEKDLVPKVIQAVRRIYSVVKLWSAPWTDVLLPIVLFFINHGEAVILDSEPYVKYLFEDVLYNSFTSPEVAFEIVNFCCENTRKLQQLNVFSKYFPNILKIIAWFPRTFLREFLELLPAMISEKTYIEIFHSLLDLPCLSAALETVKHAGKRGTVTSESAAIFRKSVEAYEDVKYKPIFAFILRQEGGNADTIDKLNVLHAVLEDCVDHPRVLVCSQVSWLMLRVYFKTILKDKEIDTLKKVFPVILERVTSIINIESFKKNIQSLLATELLTIFKIYPGLVLEYSEELIEFVLAMKCLDDGFEQFFTNVVWLIGEYASSKYDVACENVHIIKFHGAIESVTYELGRTMSSKNNKKLYSSRLVCVLMSTLAKLASRCPDLIPKVILCIDKISKLRSELCVDQAERESLLIRASELISLLRLPNIAPLILTPDPSIKEGRLHRDRHISMSFFMDTTKNMMFTK